MGKVREGPRPGRRTEEPAVQNRLAPARDGGRRGEGITGSEGSAQSPTDGGPPSSQTPRAHTLLPILKRTPSAERETLHSRLLDGRADACPKLGTATPGATLGK